MNLNFEIFSKAMYSTWCYHNDSRTLIDCGEGCANYFENRIFAIDNILFTHHHGDHILGFLSFLLCRTAAMGDNNKKVNIFYPANNQRFESLFTFLKGYYSKEFQIINLFGISPNQKFLDINSTHYFSSFKTGHTSDSLGYILNSIRRKLKEEFVGKTGADIVFLKKNFPEKEIHEEYHGKLFSYAVDAIDVDSKDIEGSKALFIDSTFLNKDDRKENSHYTLDEAYNLAKKSFCEIPIFTHLSKRYSWEQYVSYLEDKTDYKNDFRAIKVINFNRVNYLKL